MGSVVKFEDLEIPALTVVAQEQYEQCLLAIGGALKKQLEFGRVLLIVKSKLPHGEWGSWVRETFTDLKSLRTIQRHMRGAEAIATDPSLLECADSLDGILKTVEARKPSVTVIEVAASVPQVAVESPAQQQSSPRTPEADVKTRSLTLNKVLGTLINIAKDKKRHGQLIQIANEAIRRLAPEARSELLTRELLNLPTELLGKVFESVEARNHEFTK